MLAATLHDAIAEVILSNYQSIVEGMTSQFQDHAIGGGISVGMVSNLPDAVFPMKAIPVYIQLPNDVPEVKARAHPKPPISLNFQACNITPFGYTLSMTSLGGMACSGRPCTVI
jgi:hypothetical protein